MSTCFRGLFLTLIALASFGLVAQVQHALLGHPEQDEIGPKLDYIADHPGEYNTFFLGSSTIFRHVVPSVFDEELNKGGKQVKSYNLGSPGMRGLEGAYFLTRLLETLGEAAAAATIYLEPRVIAGTVQEELKKAERTIAWHDYKRTKFAFQMIAESELEGDELRDAYLDTARCFIWRQTNFAQGPRLLRRFFPRVLGESGPADFVSASAGYQALEDSTAEGVIKRGQGFAENQSGFRARVVSLNASNKHKPLELSADSTALAVARSQVEEARTAGATLIGLIPPTMSPMKYAKSVASEFEDFYSFNSPKDTPNFYLADSHFDKNHLNRAQAIAFTRLFAREVLARAKHAAR